MADNLIGLPADPLNYVYSIVQIALTQVDHLEFVIATLTHRDDRVAGAHGPKSHRVRVGVERMMRVFDRAGGESSIAIVERPPDMPNTIRTASAQKDCCFCLHT